MFNAYKTIQLTQQKSGVSYVTMNRPDVHNAFNAQMIEELTSVFKKLNDDKSVEVIVLQANGKSFSAGADINWMKGMAQASEAENKADSEKLAALMRTINFNAKATIAKIQGLALGGGVGLACCCDMVVADEGAKFGLTEAKLGLVPAVISPYVIDAVGTRKARRYFQTAEVFSASQAQDMGIVSAVVSTEEMDIWLEKQLNLLASTGPNAKEISKKLVMSVVGRTLPQQKKIDEYTTQVIAAVRVSAEGQKGLGAFLNKEKINW